MTNAQLLAMTDEEKITAFHYMVGSMQAHAQLKPQGWEVLCEALQRCAQHSVQAHAAFAAILATKSAQGKEVVA